MQDLPSAKPPGKPWSPRERSVAERRAAEEARIARDAAEKAAKEAAERAAQEAALEAELAAEEERKSREAAARAAAAEARATREASWKPRCSTPEKLARPPERLRSGGDKSHIAPMTRPRDHLRPS